MLMAMQAAELRDMAMRASNRALWVAALTAMLGCVAAGAASAAPSAPPAPTVPAVWVSRHVQFIYRGTTALYTCRGLKTGIEQLLTRLGARDLSIEECGVTDRLILFPSVRVRMQVLVPAAQGNGRRTVAGHWHRVRLFPTMDEWGSCELIREFRHTFLPLFEARNIDMSATCVPHHHVPGNHLSADVLTADQTR